MRTMNAGYETAFFMDEDKACDRRLSRAARSLLEEYLRQDSALSTTISDEDDIWTILEYWLRDARSAECPLFPSRDVLRYEEEQAIPLKPSGKHSRFAYPLLTFKERRKESKKQPNRWWKCGICSKVFSTRYYLDLHMNTNHSSPTNKATDPMLVCPAVHWCQMLGEANCHAWALKLEPFYDRGSGGWSYSDAKFIQLKYSKVAHAIPCDLEAIRTDCRRVLDSCRVSDRSLCEDLSCPSLHHFSWPDTMPGDWKAVWTYETQHHRAGTIIGIILCFLICTWVYYMTVDNSHLKKGTHWLSDPQQKVQKPKRSPPRPTTSNTSHLSGRRPLKTSIGKYA